MKKILIVGATSLIAEHCARIWSSRGDSVYLAGRNTERLESIARDLAIRGPETAVFEGFFDINALDSHSALLDAADEGLGGIDTVLIAHGTLADQEACEGSVNDTLTELQTNAISTVALLTEIANRFESRGSGTIAVISSVAGERGRASNYVYGSAKAMVTRFAEGLWHRLHRSNVSVVIIKPGFIDTPMTAGFKKGLLWTKPSAAAAAIVRAVDKRKAVVFVPSFWRLISAIVTRIPNRVFLKLKI